MSRQRVAASCDGKVAFDSWSKAERAAGRRRKNAEADVHPYRCKVCGKVHIGGGDPVRDVRKMQRSFARFLTDDKE